jgi:hypothetical protein|tara:strand:+ start:124 stop:459 length:336 start_codon:yes stop_codon:yes gene_type:complete
LSQYYNFKRASEEVALEVAVTYLDAVKYQRLVAFARANLQVHRSIRAQIAERAGGGVSQGVDLDQAVARITLTLVPQWKAILTRSAILNIICGCPSDMQRLFASYSLTSME